MRVFIISILVLFFAGCVSPEIKHRPVTNKDSSKQEPRDQKSNQTGSAANSGSANRIEPIPTNGVKSETSEDQTKPSETPSSPTEASGQAQISPTPIYISRPPVPKIALILGPGGAKTFAHIPFLHEMNRLKIPLQAIVGVEFASPIAGIFARNLSANEVEWQMMKIRDDDLVKKSFLGSEGKSSDVTIMQEFFKNSAGDQRVEAGRIPFMCPSLSLPKAQLFWMNKGSLSQVLPFCMAYAPLFKPYQGNIAGTRDVKAIADYLRKQGANIVVMVNVLSGIPLVQGPIETSQADETLWSELSYLYRAPAGVDLILNLDTGAYSVGAFNQRREIMQNSKETAQKAANYMTQKFNL